MNAEAMQKRIPLDRVPKACPSCGAGWSYIGVSGIECERGHVVLRDELLRRTA